MLLDRMASPIGELLLVTDSAGVLRALDFADCEDRMWRLTKAETTQGAAPGVDGAGRNRARHDDDLWRVGRADWPADSHPCARGGKRRQPGEHRGALPSADRG